MFLTKSKNRLRVRLVAMLTGIIMVCSMVSAVADEEQHIIEIKVTGNERVSTEAIEAAIAIPTGTPFSEATVQQAKQAVESMGFFQPGVIVGTESVDQGVRLIFTVVENPVVRRIEITGNTVVETETLLSLMRTSAGNVLNTETLLQQDIRAIMAVNTMLKYPAPIPALNLPVSPAAC